MQNTIFFIQSEYAHPIVTFTGKRNQCFKNTTTTKEQLGISLLVFNYVGVIHLYVVEQLTQAVQLLILVYLIHMQAYTFVPLSELLITSSLTVINVIYIKIRGHKACYLSFYL